MSDALKALAKNVTTEEDIDIDELANSMGLQKPGAVETVKFAPEDIPAQTPPPAAAKPAASGVSPEMEASIKGMVDQDKAMTDTVKGAGVGAVDIVQGIYNTGVDVFNGIEDLAADFGVGSGDLITDNSKVKWAEKLATGEDSASFRMARGITKYGVPIAASMGMGSGVVMGLATGAGIDAMILDPHQERLSKLVLDEAPELKNVAVLGNVLEYLKNDKEEGSLEGRFKNVVEGLLVGSGLVAGAKGLAKVFTGAMSASQKTKAYIKQKVMPQKIMPEVQIMDEAALAASEAKMGANAAADVIPASKVEIQPGSFLDEAPTIKTAAGETRINMQSPQTTELLENYAKNRTPESLARQSKGWDEVFEEAKAFKEDPAKMKALYEWDPKQRPLSEVEEAVIQLDMATHGDRVSELAEKAAASGSADDVMALFEAVDSLKFVNAIQEGSGSVAGAAFNIRKAVKDGTGGKSLAEFIQAENGQALKDKLVEEVLKHSGGKEGGLELAKKIAAMKQAGVPLKPAMDEMAKRGAFGKMADVASFVAHNGLISHPATTATNVLSNAIMTANSVATNGTAWLMGSLKGTQQGVSLSQQSAYVRGVMGGIMEGFSAAGRALRGVDDPVINSTMKLEFRRRNPISAENFGVPVEKGGVFKAIGHVVDKVGMTVGMPMRINATADAFFSTILQRGHLHQTAMAKAESLGLTGQAGKEFLEKFTSGYSKADALKQQATKAGLDDKLANKFVAQAVSKEEYQAYIEASEAALDHAQRNTFAKALDANSFAGKLDAVVEKGGPLARVALPFFKTNANIMRSAIDHSAFALLSPTTQRTIMAGGKEADIALAKIANGTGFMGIAAWMAAEGMITGPEPANYKITQALKEGNKGWQPNSIKIGENYYSFNRLDPMASVLRLGSVMSSLRNYIKDDEEYDTLATITGAAIMDFFTPEMMVDGVSRYMEALSEASKYGDDRGKVTAVLADYAARFIPFSNLSKGVRNYQDPFKVSTIAEKGDNPLETFTNKLMVKYKSITPFLSESLPLQRNLFGEALVVPDGVGPDLVSPIATTSGENSQLVQRLQYLSQYRVDQGPFNPDMAPLPIGLPSKSITMGGIRMDLTPHEYEKYQMLAAGIDPKTEKPFGPTLREALEEEVDSVWKTLESEEINAEQYDAIVGHISMVIKEYREMAQEEMRQDPELIKRWTAKKERMQEMQDVTPNANLGF